MNDYDNKGRASFCIGIFSQVQNLYISLIYNLADWIAVQREYVNTDIQGILDTRPMFHHQ